MFGLEFVTVGLLHLAAMEVKCTPKKDPKVTVKRLKNVVHYDYSKSKADLSALNVDTISPYGPEHNSKVGGLMSGEIRVESRVQFMHEKYAVSGKGCLYVDKVDVVVRVNPTIYIAKEFKKGTCEYNAILEHEKRHLQVDAVISQKYAQKIKHLIEERLKKRKKLGFGPYPLTAFDDTQKKLLDSIQEPVHTQTRKMTKERKIAQQRLDTVKEYERVRKACPVRRKKNRRL